MRLKMAHVKADVMCGDHYAVSRSSSHDKPARESSMVDCGSSSTSTSGDPGAGPSSADADAATPSLQPVQQPSRRQKHSEANPESQTVQSSDSSGQVKPLNKLLGPGSDSLA